MPCMDVGGVKSAPSNEKSGGRTYVLARLPL